MSEGPTTTSSPAQGGANPATALSGAAAPNEAAGYGAASGQPVEVPSQAPNDAKAKEPEWKTAETIGQYWYARKTVITEKEREDAWTETAKIVEEYSDDLVDRWNKEIDTLLVYAGLFSAIQTAFNIELYKRLIPDPAPATDPVLVALERISAQLSGFTVNQAFVNSTQSPFVILQSTPSTPAVPLWAVVLNVLWFSSLISSLAAASIGIMVKQWLTEYKSGVSGTSRQTARLRQLRLNSLQRWRVKEIVSILPVLLQIASGLFFAGLLILLWNLNRTVAIVGTVLVGILAAFSLSTIILPTIATHCSYLSPPSRVLFELMRLLRKALHLSRRKLSCWIASCYHHRDAASRDFDLEYSAVLDFRRKYPRIFRLCKVIFPLHSASSLTWRGMESTLVSRRAETLDGEMVATAYTTSMNTNFLQRAAVCTTELTAEAMRTCFQRIMSANIAHWGTDGHRDPMQLVHPCMWSGALIALMDTSGNETACSPSTLVAALETAYDYICLSSQQLQADALGTRLLCVDFTRVIRHYDHSALPPDSPDSLNFTELIYELIYKIYLRYVMGYIPDMNLGNDVRQHVVSVYIDDALKGLEGTIIEDKTIERALIALRIIISCVPSRTGSDYKCDDPEYKAMRSQAARGLKAFSNFLSTSPSSAGRCTIEIDNVLDALRKHGEQAGLMSAELRRAIVRYRDAYQSAHEDLPWYWDGNKEWVQKLRRELNDPGQNTTAGVPSTSGGTADPLTIAAPTAACSDSVSVAAASQQIISGTPDGIQTETVPVNGSSTPSTSPPSIAQIAPTVVPNESVASARGAADAQTELAANGYSDSTAPPPSVRTAAAKESTSDSPSAVEGEQGAPLAATGSSAPAVPPSSNDPATFDQPPVSFIPRGSEQGDVGVISHPEVRTGNGFSSASSTPPPSSGDPGLP